MFIICSADINGTPLSTLNASTWNAGLNPLVSGAAGNYQGDFVALMRQMSRGNLSTRKIDIVDAACVYGDGALYFRKHVEGGTPQTGVGAYISLTGATGKVMIVPRTLSWSGGPAVLTMEMLFLSTDGSTAPITVAAVDGDTSAESKIWVANQNKIRSLTVDFGYSIHVPPGGLSYPTEAYVMSQAPTIRQVVEDETDITTANLNPGTVTTLSAVFAEVAEGGTRGTTRTYSVTGQVYVNAVAGGKPGTVEKVVAGKGGITIT